MKYNIGDNAKTTVKRTRGDTTINENTDVTIVGVDKYGGYDIEDEDGNRISNCGWEV